jgi:hypothetical protein
VTICSCPDRSDNIRRRLPINHPRPSESASGNAGAAPLDPEPRGVSSIRKVMAAPRRDGPAPAGRCRRQVPVGSRNALPAAGPISRSGPTGAGAAGPPPAGRQALRQSCPGMPDTTDPEICTSGRCLVAGVSDPVRCLSGCRPITGYSGTGAMDTGAGELPEATTGPDAGSGSSAKVLTGRCRVLLSFGVAVWARNRRMGTRNATARTRASPCGSRRLPRPRAARRPGLARP